MIQGGCQCLCQIATRSSPDLSPHTSKQCLAQKRQSDLPLDFWKVSNLRASSRPIICVIGTGGEAEVIRGDESAANSSATAPRPADYFPSYNESSHSMKQGSRFQRGRRDDGSSRRSRAPRLAARF